MRGVLTIGVLLAVSVVTGCKAEGQATEIMLLVNTNLEPSDGLERIRIRVLRADPDAPSGMPDTPVPPPADTARGDRAVVDTEPYEHRWLGEVAIDESTEGILPITLALVPEGGDEEARPFYFEAFALGAGDAILTRVAARSAFVPRKRVSVYLWLTDACVGKSCPPGRTCWFGECIDEERPGCHVPAGVDAGLGSALGCDAGPGPTSTDAGTDAGGDGGVDAGVDGGVDGGVDAGPSCECSGTGWVECTGCRVKRCDGCNYGACQDNAGRSCTAPDDCRCTTAGGYGGSRFCVAGTWASGCCGLARDGCGSDSDCCSPYVCRSGGCCIPSGMTCTDDIYCCSGTCGVAGTCL